MAKFEPTVLHTPEYVRALTLIQQRYRDALSFTNAWHENIKRWRALYKFDHYAGEPLPGESRYCDPTYTNTVDLAVGMFQANQQRWRAKSWSPNVKDEKASDQVEKFLVGVIQANNDRNEYNMVYEVNLHFVRDGGAILYSPFVGEVVSGSVQQVQRVNYDTGLVQLENVLTEVPVLTKVIDPLKIFLLPGGPRRWAVIIRAEQMSVADVEAEYSVKIEKYNAYTSQEKAKIMETFIDYWDYALEGETDTPLESVSNVELVVKTDKRFVIRNAVLFGDQFLLHPEKPLLAMEGYQDIPYTISFFKPVARDSSADWQSILSPLETTVLALEKAVNRRQRQLDVYASLPLAAHTVGGRTLDIDPGFGKIVQLSEGEDLSFPQWQGNPPDVREQIDFLRARVQQSGFSDVMFGEGPSQISGYALSQMGDQNRIRLEQPVTHLEQLWTWWARKVMALVIHFAPNMSIRVYGRRREQDFAEEVKGTSLADFQVTCEIRPEFPNEEVRRHAMATQVAGILSPATIMEKYLNIQQPQDEHKRRMISMAQESEEFQRYAMLATFQEMADAGDPIAQLLIQSIQQQQSGDGESEEQGNNPEQPRGLQFPDGGFAPQNYSNTAPGEGAQDEVNRQANASPGMDGSII